MTASNEALRQEIEKSVALARLAKSPDGKRLVAEIERIAHDWMTNCATAPSADEWRRAQGGFAAMQDLLNQINGAGKRAETLEAQYRNRMAGAAR